MIAPTRRRGGVLIGYQRICRLRWLPYHKSSSQGRSTPLEIPRSGRDVLVMKLRNRTTSQRRGVIRGGWWEMRVTRSSPSWPGALAGEPAGGWGGHKNRQASSLFHLLSWPEYIILRELQFFHLYLLCRRVAGGGGRDELGSRISWRLFIQQDILDLLMVLYWPSRLMCKTVFEYCQVCSSLKRNCSPQ